MKHRKGVGITRILSAFFAGVIIFNCIFARNIFAINSFYATNDIVFYDGNDDCAEPVGTAGGGCPQLATIRKALSDQMNADTANAAKQVFFYRTYKEVGGQGELAIQAFMESIFNRAASRSYSIYETVDGHDGYYPYKLDSSSGSVDDATATKYATILEKVVAGSNLIKFGTGNASGNVGVGEQTYESNGERFGIETGDAGWAKDMKEKCAASAQPSSSTSKEVPDSDNARAIAKFLTTTNFSGNNDQPMNAVQMAAIMGNLYKESGFNPAAVGHSGSYFRGIAQWQDPGRWNNIPEPQVDLTTQLNYLKTELDGSYKAVLEKTGFWDASTATSGTDEAIKKATFTIARNYEVGISNGGGSIYWSNDADAEYYLQNWSGRRDSALELYNTYGGMAGNMVDNCREVGLVSGGMTLEQGKEFMMAYRNLTEDEISQYITIGSICKNGTLYNCVAVSQYFINRYTTIRYDHPVNGKEVVDSLRGLSDPEGRQFTFGSQPRPYAIFSSGSNVAEGHTGIVLGIDEVNQTIIIGESGCYTDDPNWTSAHQYPLSGYTDGSRSYAYTDGLLKSGGL